MDVQEMASVWEEVSGSGGAPKIISQRVQNVVETWPKRKQQLLQGTAEHAYKQNIEITQSEHTQSGQACGSSVLEGRSGAECCTLLSEWQAIISWLRLEWWGNRDRVLVGPGELQDELPPIKA